MSTRSTRFTTPFAPLRTPSQTMRSLKTAFSPTRASRSPSTTSYSSSISTSPLTHQAHNPSDYSPGRDSNYSTDSYRPSGGSHSRNSSPQSSRSAHSLAEILAVRRRPSTLEFEMRMERKVFGSEIGVLEPRPLGVDGGFGGVVGIFEVLDGKC